MHTKQFCLKVKAELSCNMGVIVLYMTYDQYQWDILAKTQE